MKQITPDFSASVTWHRDPVGPCQGFCAHYYFLRVHSMCTSLKDLTSPWPHPAWEMTDSSSFSVEHPRGFDKPLLWDRCLEVLAQNLPLTEGLCGCQPQGWGWVGGFTVEHEPFLSPRLERGQACFAAEALRGSVRGHLRNSDCTWPGQHDAASCCPVFSSCEHLC